MLFSFHPSSLEDLSKYSGSQLSENSAVLSDSDPVSEEGGEYEFAPFIRGEHRGEENFEDVARLFYGSYHNNIVKNAEAGTLNLFNGVRSLYRVRTVYGPKKRIISILSYHTEPNLKGSILKNVKLYGERVANIYKERGLL